MKTAKASTIVLLLLFILAVPAVVMSAAVGKITALNGNVDIVKPGQETAVAAALMQPVSEGDVIRTKSNAKAEITFTDKSAIMLAPGSRLEITEYLLKGNERKGSVLNLSRGKMRVIVAGQKKILGISFSEGQKFEVKTPVAAADAKGTDFFVFHIMGVTGVVVKNGQVNAFNRAIPGQVVPVSAGNATFVAKNKAPQQPRPAADVEIIRHSNDTNTKTGKEKDEPTDAEILTEEAAMTGGDVFGYTEPAGTVFDSELKIDTPPTQPISEKYPNTIPATSVSSSSTSSNIFLGETNDFDDYYYGSLFISDGTGLFTRGVSSGATLDGPATPWSGSTSLNVHGPYNDYGAKKDPYVWLSDIYSGKSGSGYLTYDNGAFFGVIGGVWQNKMIDGRLYSLYID
ncbi:MAG: FecR domain-containing protein, partial [Deltaproteobacteria bacterium]|nr:FecR domain-containing protein [Deltaproteobacteria bacterium]